MILICPIRTCKHYNSGVCARGTLSLDSLGRCRELWRTGQLMLPDEYEEKEYIENIIFEEGEWKEYGDNNDSDDDIDSSDAIGNDNNTGSNSGQNGRNEGNNEENGDTNKDSGYQNAKDNEAKEE